MRVFHDSFEIWMNQYASAFLSYREQYKGQVANSCWSSHWACLEGAKAREGCLNVQLPGMRMYLLIPSSSKISWRLPLQFSSPFPKRPKRRLDRRRLQLWLRRGRRQVQGGDAEDVGPRKVT